MSGYVTVDEAARLRGFRRGYVLELIGNGRLRAEVLFGRAHVRRSDIERMEKSRPGRKPGPAWQGARRERQVAEAARQVVG